MVSLKSFKLHNNTKNHVASVFQKLTDRWNGFSLWAQVLIACSLFIVGFIFVGVVADQALNDLTPGADERSVPASFNEVRSTFLRYDSNHYVNIVKSGYNPMEVAFFPLYPLLVKAVTKLGISPETALYIISLVCFYGAMLVVAYWLRYELKLRKITASPWSTLGLMLIFPTAFFLVLGYTEGLFILVTVGALYSYRRGYYIPAAILMTLATLTRVQGGAVAVFFLIDYLLSKKYKVDWKKLLPIAGAFIGLSLYMWWLWSNFGSPLAFIEAQRYWGRLDTNILSNLISSFRPVYLWYIPVLVLMLWSVYRYLGWAWLTYSLIYILIPLASGRLDSLNRYMIGLPVLFFALSLALSDKAMPKWVKTTFVISCAFLFAWNMLLFLNDYWVA